MQGAIHCGTCKRKVFFTCYNSDFMIVLNINHTDYTLMLGHLAKAFKIPHKQQDDFVIVPSSVGKGSIKILKLFNELQVLLLDASFNDSIIYQRPRSNRRYFILHFDDIFISNTVKFKVDDEVLQKTNTRHSVARLTSNLFMNTEMASAGQHIKTIRILFDEKWLKKYLGLSADTEVLQKYLSLKTESFDMEPLDDGYLKLMQELWDVQRDDPLQNIFLQNRVTMLVERFFTRLHEKSKLLEGKFKLSDDEIERLVKVEQLLVNDFSQAPPTIEGLSKIISMSSTKLKKNFKEIYGNSIFAYYQKLRMQKARELLLTGKYNVNETAAAVCYLNTTNFANAFKKQFDILPINLLGQ